MIACILLFIHICAFIAGGANAVVMPFIGAKLPTAGVETRGALFDVAAGVSKVGKVAMVLLLITGPLLLWLRFGWHAPYPIPFGVKMAGIVVMLICIGMNEPLHRKMRAGDLSVAKRSAMLGQLTALAFLVVIGAAVAAFD